MPRPRKIVSTVRISKLDGGILLNVEEGPIWISVKLTAESATGLRDKLNEILDRFDKQTQQ
jgi:hypothetical protein